MSILVCFFLSSEDVVQKTWDIEEITERFQRPDTGEKMFWKVSFRERDDIPEDIFKRTGLKEITEDNEYISRYDLTYLTPCFYQLRCKVRVNNLFLFTCYNRRVCYAHLFLFHFEYCLRLIPFIPLRGTWVYQKRNSPLMRFRSVLSTYINSPKVRRLPKSELITL